MADPTIDYHQSRVNFRSWFRNIINFERLIFVEIPHLLAIEAKLSNRSPAIKSDRYS
jgi:hypothetical protein